MNELSDEAIEVHVAHGSHVPNFLSFMHLYTLDGAVHRVGKDETAFGYREARFVQVIGAVGPDPTPMPGYTSWVRDHWSALHPHSARGAHVNFPMDEGEERIKATYRDNYERLAAIKNEYDPANLFRVNQNIKPVTLPT